MLLRNTILMTYKGVLFDSGFLVMASCQYSWRKTFELISIFDDLLLIRYGLSSLRCLTSFGRLSCFIRPIRYEWNDCSPNWCLFKKTDAVSLVQRIVQCQFSSQVVLLIHIRSNQSRPSILRFGSVLKHVPISDDLWGFSEMIVCPPQFPVVNTCNANPCY